MVSNKTQVFPIDVEELKNIAKCKTLRTHISKLLENSGLYKFNENDGDVYEFMMNWATNLEPMGIYENLEPVFWRDHKIVSQLQSKVTEDLELQASQYCIYAIYPDITPFMSESIDRLKKISNAAIKLKDLLPESDDELFFILKSIENIEIGDLHSKKVDVFFSNLSDYLNAIIGINSNIPNSSFSKLTKFGTKSKQGNVALRVWIEGCFIIWQQILGRSFEYDGRSGVSGPARFANFAFEALLPLHPEVEHSQVEYAVRAFRVKQNQDRYKSRSMVEVSINKNT